MSTEPKKHSKAKTGPDADMVVRTAERGHVANRRSRIHGDSVLPELSRVMATRAIEERGTVVPRGAVGTIVHVVRDGAGYEVEFTTPFHAVVAARRAELMPVK